MTTTTTFSDNLTAGPTVKKGPLRLAGFTGRFTEDDKFLIPTLWDKLMKSGAMKQGGVSYGVCWEAGAEVGMGYMAAVPLAEGEPVPEGLEVKELAAQTYLTFRLDLVSGDLHPQMQGAAKAIWGQLLPASGHKLVRAPDLEYYPPGFEPQAGKWVEYWVPVEG